MSASIREYSGISERDGCALLIKRFLNIVAVKIKCKTLVDPDEILLAAAAATLPCVIYDHLFYALQTWQRKRSGAVSTSGFGWFGRTVISLVLNFATSAFLAYVYRTVGHDPQDAFLVGASLWLMVSVPVLFTSRYVEESQRQFLAARILGWLAKTAIAAFSAAYFVTSRS
jgi:hypothetical protein